MLKVSIKHVRNHLAVNVFFFNFSDCTFNKKLKSAMQATGFANYTKYIYWALVSESELLKKNSSKRLLFDFIFSKSEGALRDFFFHF